MEGVNRKNDSSGTKTSLGAPTPEPEYYFEFPVYAAQNKRCAQGADLFK